MQQYNTPPSPNPNSSTQLVFFLPQSAIAHTLSCSHQPASTHLAAEAHTLQQSHSRFLPLLLTSNTAAHTQPLIRRAAARSRTCSAQLATSTTKSPARQQPNRCTPAGIHLGSNHPHASVSASAPVQPLLPAPHSRAWANHFCRTPRAPTACSCTSGHARTSAAVPHVRTAARSDLHCLLVPKLVAASTRRPDLAPPQSRAHARESPPPTPPEVNLAQAPIPC
jgi:hypothetical protein